MLRLFERDVPKDAMVRSCLFDILCSVARPKDTGRVLYLDLLLIKLVFQDSFSSSKPLMPFLALNQKPASSPARLALTCATLLSLTACQSKPSSPVIDTGYQTARAQTSLEIPPDLIGQSSAAVVKGAKVTAPDSTDKALPSVDGVSIEGEGQQRYLRVKADLDTTWQQLLGFSDYQQLPVLADDRQAGIVETDWIGDTSMESATRARMRKLLGNMAGRAPINEKYKFWLEPLNAAETAIHISHSRLLKTIIEPKYKYETAEVAWTEQPGDGLQAMQMLRKMQAYFVSQVASAEAG